MYTLGTAIPSRMESLMVSGGIPNWTYPTASVSMLTPPRGSSTISSRGTRDSYAASAAGPSARDGP